MASKVWEMRRRSGSAAGPRPGSLRRAGRLPAQLALVQRAGTSTFVAQLRFNAEGRAEDLRQRLDESPALAAAGLKGKLVTSNA